MSPEIELLERLCGEDLDLYWVAFGSTFKNLDHAKRLVHLYLKNGIVQIYEQTNPEVKLPYYSARYILDDDNNWSQDTKYYITVTDDGYDKFVTDSQSFFDRLFGRSGG